jgi:polar amino acid transport system substrate-binding protein
LTHRSENHGFAAGTPARISGAGSPSPPSTPRSGKTMKKLTSLLMLSLTAGALLAGCGKNETAPAAQSAAPAAPTRIVIGLDDNFPPMGFRNDKNELVGFDIDLAKEAAKRLGIEVEFKPIDWSAKEAELNGKRVDALWNGLTITEERRKNIGFTSAYMENHQIIVVPASSAVKTKADLAGKIVGIQDGSSAIDAVQKDPIAGSFKELKKFGDNVTALMDLTTGRLDAVVLDEVVGRYYTAKKPGEYVVLDDHFGTEEYGVGTRKDDTELLAKLQKAMDAMKADGAAARISTEWFGKDIIK